MRENIISILKTLHRIVRGECGDGDAIWLFKNQNPNFNFDDLYNLIVEFNNEYNINWILERDSDNQISWGAYQEWITITTDYEFYKQQSSWQLLKLEY